MTTPSFTHEFTKIGVALANAAHNGVMPPSGFELLDLFGVDTDINMPSGLQAKAYIRHGTKEVWVVFPGTNEAVDIASWPTAALGHGTIPLPRAFQALNMVTAPLSQQQVNEALDFTRDIQRKVGVDYEVKVAGYSLGGNLAGTVANALELKGISIEGPSPLRTLTSSQFASTLAELGLTVGESPFFVSATTDVTFVGRVGGDHPGNVQHVVIPTEEGRSVLDLYNSIPSIGGKRPDLEAFLSGYHYLTEMFSGIKLHDLSKIAQDVENDLLLIVSPGQSAKDVLQAYWNLHPDGQEKLVGMASEFGLQTELSDRSGFSSTLEERALASSSQQQEQALATLKERINAVQPHEQEDLGTGGLNARLLDKTVDSDDAASAPQPIVFASEGQTENSLFDVSDFTNTPDWDSDTFGDLDRGWLPSTQVQSKVPGDFADFFKVKPRSFVWGQEDALPRVPTFRWSEPTPEEDDIYNVDAQVAGLQTRGIQWGQDDLF